MLQILEHHQEEAWRDAEGAVSYGPTVGNHMRLPSHQKSTGRRNADMIHLHKRAKSSQDSQGPSLLQAR